jgi:anti-anti-sigma factor
MVDFDVRTSAGRGRVTVALAGECDLSVRDDLTDALLAAVAGSPVVAVDLGALTFLDSSGIHGLVTAYQLAQRSGVQLYVLNAPGVVADLLDLTGMAELLSAPPDSRPSHG